MNKIFKVVWSKVKHCYVVVSEIAKNTTSGGARRSRVRKGALAAAMAAAVLTGSFAMPNSAWAADGQATYDSYAVFRLQHWEVEARPKPEDCHEEYVYEDNGTYKVATSEGGLVGDRFLAYNVYYVKNGYSITRLNEKGDVVEVSGSPASKDVKVLAATQTRVENIGDNNQPVTTRRGDLLTVNIAQSFASATNGGNTSPPAQLKKLGGTENNLFGYRIYNSSGVLVTDAQNEQNSSNGSLVKLAKENGKYYYVKDENTKIEVATKNVYFLKDYYGGNDTTQYDVQAYTFLNDLGEVYNGVVYGINSERLATTKAEDGNIYTFWAVDASDEYTTLDKMTVNDLNESFNTIAEDLVALQKADFNSISLTSDGGNNVIAFKDFAGDTIDSINVSVTGGTVDSSGNSTGNRKVLFSSGDEHFELETGSIVSANDGKKYTKDQELKDITINGQKYTVAAPSNVEDTNTYVNSISVDRVEGNSNAAKVNFTHNDETEGYGVTFVGEGAVNVTAGADGKTITINANDTNNYVTGGIVNYDVDGEDGSATLQHKDTVTGIKPITGLKNTYTESASYDVNSKTITFTRNGNGNEAGNTYTVELTGVATTAEVNNSRTEVVAGDEKIDNSGDEKTVFTVTEISSDNDSNLKYGINVADMHVSSGVANYSEETGVGSATLKMGDGATAEIQGLRNDYTTGVSVSGNEVTFTRTNGTYGLQFESGGGDQGDRWIKIKDAQNNEINLGTGSVVVGEYADNTDNLSKITINDQDFKVPVISVNQEEGDKPTEMLTQITINDITYDIVSSGSASDYSVVGEVQKDEEGNITGYDGTYVVKEGKVILNVKDGYNSQNDEIRNIVIDGIASKDDVDAIKRIKFSTIGDNSLGLVDNSGNTLSSVKVTSSGGTDGIGNDVSIKFADDNGSITLITGSIVSGTVEKNGEEEILTAIKINDKPYDLFTATDVVSANNLKIKDNGKAHPSISGQQHGWSLEDSNNEGLTFKDTTLDTNITKVTENVDGSRTLIVADTAGTKVELDDIASASKLKEVEALAGQHTTVDYGENITVTENQATEGILDYTISLNNQVVLGTNGKAGSIVLCNVQGEQKIVLNGDEGIISGLSNTSWNSEADYSQSDKAATEAQIQKAVVGVRNDITTNIGELNNLSVTGGKEVNGKYHGWQLEDSSVKDENGNTVTKTYSDTTLDAKITTVTDNEDGSRTLTVADTAGHQVVLDDIASASKLKEVGERVDVLDSNVNEIKTNIKTINKSINDLGDRIGDVETNIDNITKHLDSIEGNVINDSDLSYEYTETGGGNGTLKLQHTVNNDDGSETSTDILEIKGLKDTTLIAGEATVSNDTDFGRDYSFKDTKENVVTLKDVASANTLKTVKEQVDKNTETLKEHTTTLESHTNTLKEHSEKIETNTKSIEKERLERIEMDKAIINYTEHQVGAIDSKLNKINSRVDKVGAGAAALAALHPMDFDPDDKLSFAVGAGNYAGETATALGAFYRPNEKVMMNVAGTYGNGENMVNMGVSFALDRTNNVSNSRTAMAREIVDLREQVATQGQQIAQLIALVNQLAGTPAAKNSAEVLFPDIPENHWAYEYIHSLADRGIVEGYPDGNFGGDRTMTRYEFATMLFKAMQNGVVLSEQIRQEFEKELGRIRVDRVKGADDDANKIERVRVNTDVDRDDYGSKIVMVSAGK